MIVEQCHILEEVSKVLNHPKVFKMMADDLTQSPYEAPEGFYIMDEDRRGVVRVDPINGICCSVHIATLPKMWGKAQDFVMAALSWGFRNTRYTKVIAIVPDFNKLTRKLCLKCGFNVEGVIRESFLKDWKYHDMTVFGLTKAQFLA